jgi:flagellar hook protein FlgE
VLGQLGTLTFNTDGSVNTAFAGYPTTETLTAAQLGYAGSVNDVTFPVDFGGSTQYGSLFTVNALSQDGFASGKLAGFNIGDDGVILGRYTNGQSRNLGQVILASFRNPQGLQPMGNNIWTATSTSGAEMDGAPGSSGQYGPIQSSALEDSNVDLTAELVNMITQQRVYQANAQTIKTQDTIMQTLVNLR